MKKVFDFGKYAIDSARKVNAVTVEINLRETDKGPEFTASATVWNSKNTNCIMGGQCLDSLVPYLKSNTTFMEIYRLWGLYHLNGAHAWCTCEHEENPKDKIKVYSMRYNEEGERLSKIRDLGIFTHFIEVTEEGLKNIPSALYELNSYKTLRETGIEEKIRGRVTYNEVLSPEGLIGKECPTCGAKYGHSWYYHPIPEEDLQKIKELINMG